MPLLALACAVTVVAATRAGAWRPDRCERFAAASIARAEAVTGAGPAVLVVGDSYSAGLLLGDSVQSWPSRLPGRVHVAGFSGSGFARHASPCGDRSFATRAADALRPRLGTVIVQGGLNDVDQPEADVRAGFDRLMRVLEGRDVVVVGPPAAPARARGAARLDALLRDLAGQAGAAYVSTYDLDLPYDDDRLHLTSRGHQLFGDAVAARM